MIRRPLTALLAALLATAPIGAAAEPVTLADLAIDGAWSRPGIPNRPAAAYLSVTNRGSADDALVAAASSAFEAVELHTVEMTDGVMRMSRVETIPIPAGETVTLAPGGFHVMLFGAETPFAEGGSFPLVLTFAEAGEVEVAVEVSKQGPAADDDGQMDHGEMNHGSMNHGEMNHGAGAPE